MKKTAALALAVAGLYMGRVALAAPPEIADRPPVVQHGLNDGDAEGDGDLNSAVAGAPTAGGTTALTPITNHGGPVMGTPTVYLIWYGNWAQSNGTDNAAGKQIVRNFLGSVGGSPYFNINQTYGATGNVVLSPNEYVDAYSKGNRLSDANIQSIVSAAIASGQLGSANSNGVYFVLTSSDVNERSGFCTKYCGWHTHGSIAGVDVKYSFVGNAARCLSGCAAQTVGPNGNAGVDGMLSVVAHELEETVSDPDLNAWYDASGAENGDKCAWTFGSAQFLSGGAYANMTLGGHSYLIQRNLDASNNKCYVAKGGQQ